MGDYIKAEKKHYEQWLAKSESSLVEALLILNEIHLKESSELSSVELLHSVAKKEVKCDLELVFPYNSIFLFRMQSIVSMISRNEIDVLSKPENFSKLNWINCYGSYFLLKFPKQSLKLLETTVRPIDFVNQLYMNKRILPYELLWLMDAEKNPNKSSSEDKPMDPRVEKTLYMYFYAFVKKQFNYNPKASKNVDTSKIMRLIQKTGYSTSHATVKRHLDKAFQVAEEFLDQI